jgi:DNA-binding FrmR family transcriptional regulator
MHLEPHVRQRLRRAQGQLKGIEKMLDEGRDVDDVLIQLMAVRAAVDAITGEIVISHVEDCAARLTPSELPSSVARTVRTLLRSS